MDFTNSKSYEDLRDYLLKLDKNHHTLGNRIFYLAVSPVFFGDIVDNLHETCMDQGKNNQSRVVIEKPFGRDLGSATFLNDKIVKAFGEENTFRIDHYLGKEMLQNIMVIRFSNILFEPLWNKEYINQIQISSNETLGVETRGNYYEHSGAIRDMVQSHMLQLLSLIAMEKPLNLDAKSIRDEKVKVLKQLKKYSKEEINQNIVRGQYGASNNTLAYRDENSVSRDSETETFVALKLEVDNKRWNGVLFYIRTGKRMPKKSTEIIIQFKKPVPSLYQGQDEKPNILVIHIQPTEGVYFQFNAKEPGTRHRIIPVHMDFCQNCRIGINSPESYERLLFDVMRGDTTLFARWDEVLYSWDFIDSIIKVWKEETPEFPNYEAGTSGPIEAEQLLKQEDRDWITIKEDIWKYSI